MNRCTSEFLLALLVLCLSASFVAGGDVVLEDTGFAVRLEAGMIGFPLFGGAATVQAAFGNDLAVAFLRAELPMLPLFDVAFTGAAVLPRDGLTASIGVVRDPAMSWTGVTFTAEASPPGWLLYENRLVLIGGLHAGATARSSLRGTAVPAEVVLSPYLSSVLGLGKAIATSTLASDLRMTSGSTSVTSHVSVSLQWQTATLAAVAEFAGPLKELAGVSLSLELHEIGLTVAGAAIPTGSSALYEIRASLAFGTVSLLRHVADEGGSICAGGTCYGP